MESSSELDEIRSRIQERWSRLQRFTILGVISFAAFLLVMTDTVYLPSMIHIQQDLDTTELLVTLSVALFAFVIGLMPLLWGPLSDAIGRRWLLVLSMAFFTAVSLVLTWATNMGMFLALRVCQGVGISSVFAVGSGEYRPMRLESVRLVYRCMPS
eukprot:TRINITY_DN5115_c3_g1_i2.p2 TRINITY_DN5115_c3_g1~~TRINITY_DN5115_c3_g1_i2.p2  ORF type:complete len:156 (+),score=27.52 TRINITY_DN5115_c3_g1_i2:745-1212(+)